MQSSGGLEEQARSLAAQIMADEDSASFSETHMAFLQRECAKLMKKKLQLAKVEQDAARDMKRKKMFNNNNNKNGDNNRQPSAPAAAAVQSSEVPKAS